MSDKYFVNNNDLQSVADAIRKKTNSTEKLTFPDQFISEIEKTSISEEYDGEYKVTPKTTDQVLQTENKMMKQDLTILAIPFYSVSNEVGGNTIYIGE